VRLYDLVKHEQIKKLTSGASSHSSLDIHPSGDHLLVGSHEGQLYWFDLDFSVRPYKVLHNHSKAIRSISIHPSYPLISSAGDDGLLQITHATVYSDLSSNTLLIPVRRIDDFKGKRITAIKFHPTQPWIFAATSKGDLSLFV
jgi:ribosome biogenesis protein ERB1